MPLIWSSENVPGRTVATPGTDAEKNLAPAPDSLLFWSKVFTVAGILAAVLAAGGLVFHEKIFRDVGPWALVAFEAIGKKLKSTAKRRAERAKNLSA